MSVTREDKIAILLDHFPGPQTLGPSVSKWLWMLAISTGFIILGVAFIRSPNMFSDTWIANGLGAALVSLKMARNTLDVVAGFGWVTTVFFGIGSVVSIISLIPGAGGLTLDKSGFAVRSLHRRHVVRWEDVGEFAVAEVKYGFGSKQFVAFDDRAAPSSAATAMNTRLIGYNGALPDTYGLSVEDLTRLMSLWRERALRQTN